MVTYPYNLTGLQTSTTLHELVNYADLASGHILVNLLMVAIFFILFLSLKKDSTHDAILASSFVCFLISAILVYAKMLLLIWPITFLAVMAFSVLFDQFSGNS